MNLQSNHMLDQLKELFGKEELSDGKLHIIEVDETFPLIKNKEDGGSRELSKIDKLNQLVERDKQCASSSIVKTTCGEVSEINTNNAGESFFCTLPVHFLVLTLQSDYFKCMLCASGMKESQTNEIKLKVNIGDGEFLKLLIKSFYDHECLNELDAMQLLRIMILADRYACDIIIKRIAELIPSLFLDDISKCEEVVQLISNKKYCLNISKETALKFLKCSANFAAETFCPLENKDESTHTTFQNISFDLLLAMLKYKEFLTWHENSLLYYIDVWFQFDSTRQTEKNIQLILLEINYNYLTPEFLSDVISEDHTVFNIWPEFKRWFLHVISYHAFSPKRSCFGQFGKRINNNRNYKSDDDVIGWIIEMDKAAPMSFKPEKRYSVYRGYEIHPFIFLQANDNLPNDYQMLLVLFIPNIKETIKNKVSCEDVVVEFSIALSILPENEYIEDSTSFDIVSEHFREMSFQYRIGSQQSYFNLGTIEKRCVEIWRTLSIALIFKEKSKRWGAFIAGHVKKLQSSPFAVKYLEAEQDDSL